MKDENGNLYERTESLFVSERYKVFLLTGQPPLGAPSGRRADILAKPFHTFDPATLEHMMTVARPVSADPTDRVSPGLVTNSRSLMVSDRMTGTATLFALGALDDDVKIKLSYTGPAVEETYTTAWDKYALPSVALSRDIGVSQPLQLTTSARKQPRGFNL